MRRIVLSLDRSRRSATSRRRPSWGTGSRGAASHVRQVPAIRRSAMWVRSRCSRTTRIAATSSLRSSEKTRSRVTVAALTCAVSRRRGRVHEPWWIQRKIEYDARQEPTKLFLRRNGRMRMSFAPWSERRPQRCELDRPCTFARSSEAFRAGLHLTEGSPSTTFSIPGGL